jgi:hypothetical protein
MQKFNREPARVIQKVPGKILQDLDSELNTDEMKELVCLNWGFLGN